MNTASASNRNWRTYGALILIGAFVTGCATVKSGAHHDEFASFGNYQSFAWIADKPLILGDGDQPSISPLAEKKIVQAINDELTGKGFTYSENPDQADFVVAYTVGTREKIVATSYPTAYRGRWGWHLYGRYYYQTEVVHRTYTEGTLGIDIFDGKTKKPVWHGWASKTVTSADRNDPSPAIEEAVAEIIKRFPPSL
jgi:hypothetical protein